MSSKSRVPRWSRSWAMSTTAKPRCSTRFVKPTLPRRSGWHHPAHRRLQGEIHQGGLSGLGSRDRLPGYTWPRSVYPHACARRQGHRHRRHRRGCRRRRHAADPRGRRPRQGRGSADHRCGQQDRQARCAARTRQAAIERSRTVSRRVGRQYRLRRSLRQEAPKPRSARWR